MRKYVKINTVLETEEESSGEWHTFHATIQNPGFSQQQQQKKLSHPSRKPHYAIQVSSGGYFSTKEYF